MNTILDIDLPDLRIRNLNELLDVRRASGAKEFREVFNNFFNK